MKRFIAGEASLVYAAARGATRRRRKRPSEPRRATWESRRKSTTKTDPFCMEKIDSFSRSDFQRDTYK